MNETIQAILQRVMDAGIDYVPTVLGALGILVLGWLIALVLRTLVIRVLRRTTIDDRLGEWITGRKDIEVESAAGSVVFWIAMLFVVMAVFQTLRLTDLAEPLNVFLTELSLFASRLGGAAALLLLAWAVATVVRNVLSGILGRVDLDRRLGAVRDDGAAAPALTASISQAGYWLVFLLFLPAVLGALALEGLLQPVQALIDELLGFLPNLLGAGVTLAIGWFVASLVRRITANLGTAAGLDRAGERLGLKPVLGQMNLSALIGYVVYGLILIPVLIATLNTLELDAVTAPASQMLGSILAAIPMLFGAVLVVFVAYVVGRVLANLVQTVLAGAGFDNISVGLGLSRTQFEGRSPSQIAGMLILVTIMLLASIESANLLGFESLSALIRDFLVLGGRIVFGLVLLAVGLFLAKLAAGTIAASGLRHGPWLAMAARVSILVLSGAVALRHMGLANEIITVAFGTLFGGVAVAAVLAFGLGSRHVATRLVDEWMDRWSGTRDSANAPPAKDSESAEGA